MSSLMRQSAARRLGALWGAIALIWLPALPALGATRLVVPAGTKVGLEFFTPISSATLIVGEQIHFKVIADVAVRHHVVIQSGTPVIGTVTKVTKPGESGRSAAVVVGFLAAAGVDGKPIPLKDLTIDMEHIAKNAPEPGHAGAITLGRVGLVSGALINSGYVVVPAGSVVTDATAASVGVAAM